MNEGRTTLIFLGVAAVTLGLAWWSRPESALSEQAASIERVGEEVFPSFSDPEAATSMGIVKYDEALGVKSNFEVARDRDSNLWTLPSHDGYPADAAEQLQKATTPLIGLEVLKVVSDVAGDHELYGVVNPDNDELAMGASGVGMLVEFKDKSDEVLASLIVGKEVPQSEGLRYVRIPSEDAVYEVEIDSAAFSTTFGDWIDSELLGIRSMDITKVSVRDYILRDELVGRTLELKFDAEVRNEQNEWSLEKLTSYVENQPVEAEIGENEELNTEYLNALKTAVQDLEIIDVQRKPKGLAADLKATDALLKDKESIENLANQGFYAASVNGNTEIFSEGGETTIGTSEGVDYVLRFGEATARLTSGDDEDEDGGLRRYLLVMAKLDESQFPAPELEPLPETVEEMLARERGEAANVIPEMSPESSQPLQEEPAEGAKENPANAESPAQASEEEPKVNQEPAKSPAVEEPAEKNSTEDKPAGDKPAEDKPAEDKPAEDKPAEDKPAEDKATEEATPQENPSSAKTPTEEAPKKQPESDSPAADEPNSDDPAEDELNECGVFPQEDDSQEDEPAQEESSEGKTEEAASVTEGETPAEATTASQDGASPSSSDDSNTSEPTQEELEERLEAVRDEIAKENQRKIDQRNDEIDAARKKVLELNARFSEWYYVVSDSVYQKLKVSREDLFKEKGEPKPMNLPSNFSPNLDGLMPQP